MAEVIKRKDLSLETKKALALVEPKVDDLQKNIDALHLELHSVLDEMRPLKEREKIIRDKIVAINPKLSGLKGTVSSIFAAEQLKNENARSKALEVIISEHK